jgi:dienelactone hydrolase
MPITPLLGLLTAALAAAPAPAEVRFPGDPVGTTVPERFRLPAQSFPVETRPRFDLPHAGVEVLDVRFPSPVTTAHPENNTVHAELFRPKKPGKFPTVVVLDILDGRQIVSRGEALWLARHDINALVVILPYYGPRRPAEGRHRLISTDVASSVTNITQGVLDCRRAVAWLTTRPDVDAGKISVLGTSLGSFVGGLVAAAEPNVRSAALLLGGGGLVDAFYDHPQAKLVTQAMALVGITKDTIRPMIAPADPLTYAPQLRTKRLLLIAASRDEVVPPVAMKRLWEETGKPKIVWYDATHVGAAAFAFPVMGEVTRFVKE